MTGGVTRSLGVASGDRAGAGGTLMTSYPGSRHQRAPGRALGRPHHALVDRRWPTRLILGTTGSKGFSTVFWGVIATDQALQLSILAISFYWLAP